MSTPQYMVNMLGQGPMTPMGTEMIQINPPNLNDYSSEEDSDEDDNEARPLTHEELKSKTMKVIHRRANAGPRARSCGSHVRSPTAQPARGPHVRAARASLVRSIRST